MGKFIFDLQLFEDTGSSNITTFEALKTALEGTSATDIKITGSITVPAGTTEIDLHGKTVTVSGSVDGALKFTSAGTYKIKNGTLKSDGTGNAGTGNVILWVADESSSVNINLDLESDLTIETSGGAHGPCLYIRACW